MCPKRSQYDQHEQDLLIPRPRLDLKPILEHYSTTDTIKTHVQIHIDAILYTQTSFTNQIFIQQCTGS